MDQAGADLEKAIRCDSNYPLAYFVLGAVYNSTLRFDDAIRVLERGITLSPASWQGYFESGKAYLGKGDYQASLRQLNKAQQWGPNYAQVHLIKAQALLDMKDYGNAATELEAYLAHDSQGPQAARARQILDRVRLIINNAPK